MFDTNRFGLITGSRCSVLFPKRSAEKGQRTYAKQLANQMYLSSTMKIILGKLNTVKMLKAQHLSTTSSISARMPSTSLTLKCIWSMAGQLIVSLLNGV
jgi:hypothetical protein